MDSIVVKPWMLIKCNKSIFLTDASIKKHKANINGTATKQYFQRFPSLQNFHMISSQTLLHNSDLSVVMNCPLCSLIFHLPATFSKSESKCPYFLQRTLSEVHSFYKTVSGSWAPLQQTDITHTQWLKHLHTPSWINTSCFSTAHHSCSDDKGRNTKNISSSGSS